MKRSLLALTAVLLLVAAACGDAGAPVADDDAPSLPAASAPAATSVDAAVSPPLSDFPAVDVIDLAGGNVNLASLAPSQNPVLLWFWAPH